MVENIRVHVHVSREERSCANRICNCFVSGFNSQLPTMPIHCPCLHSSLVVVVEEEDCHGAGDLAGDEAEDDGEEGPAVAVAQPRRRQHRDRDQLVGHLRLDDRDVHHLTDEQDEACKEEHFSSLSEGHTIMSLSTGSSKRNQLKLGDFGTNLLKLADYLCKGWSIY